MSAAVTPPRTRCQPGGRRYVLTRVDAVISRGGRGDSGLRSVTATSRMFRLGGVLAATALAAGCARGWDGGLEAVTLGAATQRMAWLAGLHDGDRLDQAGREVSVELRRIGDLVAPSGRIVACDALVVDPTPLPTDIPPGRYPVWLGIAHLPRGTVVAWATLEVAPRPAVRWEVSDLPVDSDGDGIADALGYAADSGRGCFMDQTTAWEVNAALARDPDAGLRRVVGELARNRRGSSWTFSTIPWDERSGANEVAFTTGWGDGTYVSYAGFDAEDRVVALTTDFGVLDPLETGEP